MEDFLMELDKRYYQSRAVFVGSSVIFLVILIIREFFSIDSRMKNDPNNYLKVYKKYKNNKEYKMKKRKNNIKIWATLIIPTNISCLLFFEDCWYTGGIARVISFWVISFIIVLIATIPINIFLISPTENIFEKMLMEVCGLKKNDRNYIMMFEDDRTIELKKNTKVVKRGWYVIPSRKMKEFFIAKIELKRNFTSGEEIDFGDEIRRILEKYHYLKRKPRLFIANNCLVIECMLFSNDYGKKRLTYLEIKTIEMFKELINELVPLLENNMIENC